MIRRMRAPNPGAIGVTFVSVLIFAPAAATLAQERGQFRSSASTVAVYTTVTDASGQLVPHLGRDDFEVYDNGKRQPISIFTNDVQPITVVMMLDRSASMLANFSLVERAAGSFIDRLLPGDKVRIGSFSDRIQLDPREFTSDQGVLRVILRTELQPAGPTPLWNAVGVGMTALLRQEGRRVVLVFTDGVDRPLTGGRNVSLGDAIKRAEHEDVMVYGIGLASRFGGRASGRRGGMAGRGMGGGGQRGGQPDNKPDPGLRKLALASGGGYFELTSTRDLAATFARVADELHRQYLIGFEPQKLDGKAHTLEVRVKGEGLVARARKSYIAAR
jgi:Ca-activated chloride channel family protein